ncbi:hypothetical protein, partial [Victivallis vadensis]
MPQKATKILEFSAPNSGKKSCGNLLVFRFNFQSTAQNYTSLMEKSNCFSRKNYLSSKNKIDFLLPE